MVGYNFQVMFEEQIVDRTKRQTVRADRKRHARSGEPMQLFCDQRSRRCRKLLSPDPLCVGVRRIEICTNDLFPVALASIAIDGIPLRSAEIELFARADGFAPERLWDVRRTNNFLRPTARENMGVFWLARHGSGRFEGVLLQWEPS